MAYFRGTGLVRRRTYDCRTTFSQLVLQLHAMPQLRMRVLLSAGIGLASGLLCWIWLTHFQLGAYDFTWALYPARELLAGRNPYAHIPPGAVGYPLTAALLAVPFAWFSDTAAGALFFGTSSALLAFGLTQKSYVRLMVLLAYPYWSSLMTAQWAPLVMAGALVPWLLPATTAKPQIGLPIFLTYSNIRGVLASLVLVGLTFIAMPLWIRDWLPQTAAYQHFFPILVWPGPLLFLALWKYRDRDAQFLFFSALMPQRWFYDSLTLWLIPKSRREIVWTVFLSWVPGVWRWYYIPHTFSEVGQWTVAFLYLPLLSVVLLRPRSFGGDGASADKNQSQ